MLVLPVFKLSMVININTFSKALNFPESFHVFFVNIFVLILLIDAIFTQSRIGVFAAMQFSGRLKMKIL